MKPQTQHDWFWLAVFAALLLVLIFFCSCITRETHTAVERQVIVEKTVIIQGERGAAQWTQLKNESEI
jgi:hypothetical protein